MGMNTDTSQTYNLINKGYDTLNIMALIFIPAFPIAGMIIGADWFSISICLLMIILHQLVARFFIEDSASWCLKNFSRAEAEAMCSTCLVNPATAISLAWMLLVPQIALWGVLVNVYGGALLVAGAFCVCVLPGLASFAMKAIMNSFGLQDNPQPLLNYSESYENWLATRNWNLSGLIEFNLEYDKVLELVNSRNHSTYRRELETLKITMVESEIRAETNNKVYGDYDEKNLLKQINEAYKRLLRAEKPAARAMIDEQLSHLHGTLDKLKRHKESQELYELQKDTVLSSLRHMRLRLIENEEISLDELTNINERATSIHRIMLLLESKVAVCKPETTANRLIRIAKTLEKSSAA